VSTEEPVATAAAAPAIARPVAHDSHAHLIFPNLLDTFRSLLSIIVIALFVLTFVVQALSHSLRIDGANSIGRRLFVSQQVGLWGAGSLALASAYQQVRRGDVIVFHFPLDPSDHVVKRVVGVPGDRIRLQNGVVCINGQKQSEPFAIFEGAYQDNFRDQFPAKLYTDPGVDTHWWMQMRHDVQNGELVVPPASISCSATIATTAAIAATGALCPVPMLWVCLSSFTSPCTSPRLPMPTRCRMIDSDTRRARSTP